MYVYMYVFMRACVYDIYMFVCLLAYFWIFLSFDVCLNKFINVFKYVFWCVCNLRNSWTLWFTYFISQCKVLAHASIHTCILACSSHCFYFPCPFLRLCEYYIHVKFFYRPIILSRSSACAVFPTISIDSHVHRRSFPSRLHGQNHIPRVRLSITSIAIKWACRMSASTCGTCSMFMRRATYSGFFLILFILLSLFLSPSLSSFSFYPIL